MIIPVIQKSYKPEVPNNGYWDYAFIESILRRELWNPVEGFEFQFYNQFSDMSENEYYPVVIVMIPARYHADKIDEINRDVNFFGSVLLMLIGDEDGTFPTEKLKHPNMKVWLMLPHNGQNKNVDRFMLNGWPKDTRKYLMSTGTYKKTENWFFAGQVTHTRRRECVKALKTMTEVNTGLLIETDGFTKGLPHDQYFKYMADAKIVPCPSGAVIPESFRFYEALEAGALPIVDAIAPPAKKINDFWQFLFGQYEFPFPLMKDWNTLPGIIAYHLDTYPKAANLTYAWWQQKKREIAYNVRDDIKFLTRNMTLSATAQSNDSLLRDKITVLIPTSYIPSHPDTSIIEETIARVRGYLPESEIIIIFDGIRDEQKEHEADYEEYKRVMLHKCNFEWQNILPMVFESHTHQAGMTRKALEQVKTPLILFVEHDTPICEEIPFLDLAAIIERGEANMIRLHHEALILEVHKHLMLDMEPITMNNIPVVRTGQWSQRPHLASKEFYRQILDRYFSPGAITMIEDCIIGKVSEAFFLRGQVGWNEFKVVIYSPPGDMKRSYHLDGRGSVSKFENTFKF